MRDHGLSDVRPLLERCRVVAVLGATDRQGRAGHYVGRYLASQGYVVLPVNPVKVGITLFGHPVKSSLQDLDQPVDMVDVFRRADHLEAHVDEILGMRPRPAVVWFQQGIRHDAVAERLRAAGIEVVQDRCTLADHRALGLGRPGRGER